ncbi:hypothetical protein [Spirosoma endbachense]|uniref:Uncharacterized protein n=1 Tax=Spirosoma endbachense TaxID=2666025 RepID=A0A6P1VPT2_9BACT|nr:hypothetical protein [Spirosoma endbachense]QHV93980.1 hypothetical protein GJR95_02600 [Spirosoma endbachense]
MFGYIFIFITFFFYIGLSMLTASKPSLSGDNAMGYGLALFFLGIGFSICSLILTIIINSTGGFDWVLGGGGKRTILVLLAWLFMALTTFFCALFKWEWHNDTVYPQFLHWISVRHGQIFIPLFWLVVCFFSLNSGWQSAVSPTVFKISFWVGWGIGALFSGGLLLGYLRDSAKLARIEMASRIEQEDRWHKEGLTFIASQKPEDPIFSLLNYSTRYQPEDTRNAALAKIKAHPAWEAELLALLSDKRSYREVYYFLDSNRVDHPELFVKPLNQSILWLSASIKADIKDSNNLQHWSFDSYGIERLLTAIDDQFQNQGVDFYPNVLGLKQALDTTPPERFKDVRFTVTGVVNDWLRKHKK